MKKKILATSVITGAVLTIGAMGTASAAEAPIYDSIPAPLPGNIPSIGFQATQTAELGDRIQFAAGTDRTLESVTVTMSSWACQQGAWNTGDCESEPGKTFDHPITFTIYQVAADGTVGPQVASVEKVVEVPFRPSSDPGSPSGQWSDSTGTWFNGYAFNATFDFSDKGIELPDEVIYGVKYNTQSWGYTPTHESGFYDSLNVGLKTGAPSNGAPSTGTDVDPTKWFRAVGSAPVFASAPQNANSGVAVRFNTMNDAPVATNDSVTVSKNRSGTIAALTNDTDSDADTLSVAIHTQGAKGAVTYSESNKSFTYTPVKGFTGTDTFTYTISDGHGGSATGVVTVIVAK